MKNSQRHRAKTSSGAPRREGLRPRRGQTSAPEDGGVSEEHVGGVNEPGDEEEIEHTGRDVGEAEEDGRKKRKRSSSFQSPTTTTSTAILTPITLKVKTFMDVGVELLRSSPCASDAETVKFKQPFFTWILNGEMPKGNKMVPPAEFEFTGMYQPAPYVRSMGIAMGNALRYGLRYVGMIASTFDESLNELQDRPMLQAILAGLFMSVPPDGYTMSSKLASDVLVWEDNQIVKKEKLSRQHYDHGRIRTEVGNAKRSITRWKTDVLMQAKDESGKWQKRLLIEHKFVFHKDDFCEAIMSACNHLLESRGLMDRLYVQVWDERVRNGIMDAFGTVDVEGGRVTTESYLAYERTVGKLRGYLGDKFPEASYKRCPQSLEALQQRFEDLNNEFVDTYNVNLPDNRYLIGTFYQDPNTLPLPTRSAVTSKEACNLFQSLLRILVGDQVLDWDWDTLKAVMQQRERFLLSKQEKFVKRSLGEQINIFDVESMGTTPRGYPGGCWKVTETSNAWHIELIWQTWMRAGSKVNLTEGGRMLNITEGGNQGRIVQIWFPHPLDMSKSELTFRQSTLVFSAAKLKIEDFCYLS